MVPGTGATSNNENDLVAEWESNNKDIKTELQTSLNPEACEELFDTLAEWNEYLENHVPYFQEPQS